MARSMRPGEQALAQKDECRVHQDRQQGDPGDIGDDDVQRELTAHEEDPVAKADIGRDCLRGDEEDPCRA